MSLLAKHGLLFRIKDNIPTGVVNLRGITRLVSLGDSIMAGSNASPSSNAFRELLFNEFLWTDTNLSVGGRGYWEAIDNFNETSFTRQNTLVIDETGLNDARRSWTQQTRNKVRASIDSILARLAGLNATASGASAVTRSGGTFAGFDAATLGGVYGTGALPGNFASTSSDIGATWSWTCNTESFFIAFSASDGSVARGTCEVYVDSVLIDTITDLDDQWDGVSDGSYDNARGPDTRVYWDNGAGPHTVEVVVTSANPVPIDRFVELDTPENVGVFLLIEAPKVVDYAKPGLDQASNAVMNALNKIRTNRLNIFNNRGYRFYYIPIMTTSGGYYDLANIDPTDDVHPLNAGHAQIYDSIVRFTDIILRDTFTGASVSIASHSPEIGGAWTLQSGTCTINGSGRMVASVAANVTQSTGVSDIDSTVDAQITTTNNALNLIFRYTDDSNYIQVQLLVNGASSTSSLFNRVSGTNNLITSVTGLNYSINTDYRLKVLLVANRIRFWVNDTEIFDYTDTLNANIGINNPTGTVHGVRVTTVASFDSITMI